MPLYTKSDTGYIKEFYVAGPKLTWRQKQAINHDQKGEYNWYHDSLLPPLGHFAWIVPLHAVFFWLISVGANATTAPGQFWMGILGALWFAAVMLFWWHVYLNQAVRHLRKTTHIAEIGDDMRLYYLTEGSVDNKRPLDFSKWFYTQLKKDAPNFGRVHAITDEYLRATASAQKLAKPSNRGWHAALNDDLIATSNVAYEKLRPIYEQATDEKKRREQEEQARIASETEFREGEERRITEQRVTMAKQDMEKYILGHQALTDL